jgi:hypothetical protein
MERMLGLLIGITTVFVVLSILASHIQEMWSSYSARRAVSLETAIRRMLQDPGLINLFFSHPLIENISFSTTRGPLLRRSAPLQPRPSYIPSTLFNRVLQASLMTAHDISSSDLPGLIRALPDSPLKARLTTLTLGIENDAAACNFAVEKWYDETMERVSGLYKRDTYFPLLLLGIGLAVLCNANLLHMTSVLWRSAAARDEVSSLAQMYGCREGAPCAAPNYITARRDLENNLKLLPLGYTDFSFRDYWRDCCRSPASLPLGHWGYNLAGWLLTALAVSLGAPFWFDLLNQFVNLRMAESRPRTFP